jgi:hypothetical protein
LFDVEDWFFKKKYAPLPRATRHQVLGALKNEIPS